MKDDLLLHKVKASQLSLPIWSVMLVLAVTNQQQMLYPEFGLVILLATLMLGCLTIISGLTLISLPQLVGLWSLSALIMLSAARAGDFHWGAQFSLFFSVAAAAIILRYGNRRYASYYILLPFWYYAGYIVFRLAQDPDPSNVFINSRNWISFYLVIFVSTYYLNAIFKESTASVVPALVTLILCYYALGRSGMVSSTGILLAILLYQRRLWALALSFPVLGYAFFNVLLPRADEIDVFRLTNPFAGDDRFTIWDAFFSALDPTALFIGMDITVVEAAVGYSNLHSSMLTAVVHLGIIGYVLWLITLVTILSLLGKSWSAGMIYASLMLRASTDTGLLFGFYDTPFWMAVMFAFGKRVNTLHRRETGVQPGVCLNEMGNERSFRIS